LSYVDPYDGFIVDKVWDMAFEDGARPSGSMEKPSVDFSKTASSNEKTMFEIVDLDNTFASFFHGQSSLGGYNLMGLEWQLSSESMSETEAGEWMIAMELVTENGEIISGIEEYELSPYFLASKEIYGNYGHNGKFYSKP
jgi:hypothetical protein